MSSDSNMTELYESIIIQLMAKLSKVDPMKITQAKIKVEVPIDSYTSLTIEKTNRHNLYPIVLMDFNFSVVNNE